MAHRPGGSNPFPADDDDTTGFGRTKEQIAIRRMEESSANSLRKLNETYGMAVATTEELDVQAETMDRVEQKQDEIYHDLTKSKQNMQKIKSWLPSFSRKKNVTEITDPRGMKQPKPTKTKAPPPKKPTSLDQYESTGSKVADENLDEMSRVLDRLMGAGELIGEQLDDSDRQIERVKYKVDRNQRGIDALNKDIGRQLYK